ncbi:MAG: right-handed parallel beta-helix repeat-containing protein, partial [Candidatus Limnocylindrus sp.]
ISVMKRSATLVFLMLAASMGAAPAAVRANGFPLQVDTWVAASTSGAVANGSTAGSSCSDPGFVADGTDDDVEIGYAFQDVLPGGTVHLCAGTYNLTSEIVHNDEVTIVGAGKGRTFVIGTAEFDESGAFVGSDGNAFLFGTDMTMRGLTVRGFWSAYGAVYGDSLTARNVRFDYNGNYSDDGGAVWVGDVTVRDSVFAHNYSELNGGAIASSRTVAIRTRFTKNEAVEHGGAVDVAVAVNSSRFVDCTFTRNRAGIQGGALFSHTNSIVSIRRSTFLRNRSVSHGGAARFYESTVRVVNSRFERNRASDAGGAFDAYLGRLRVNGSTFVRNRAASNGGGAVSWEQDRLIVRRSSFYFNRSGARGGGLIVNDVVEPARVEYSTFVENHGRWGGGLALTGGAPLHVRGNAFTSNSSPAGGAIFLYTCGPTLNRDQARRVRRSNTYSENRSRGEHPKVLADIVPC